MESKLNIPVKGKIVDEHTRCIHYQSIRDIIAIRMKCCNDYYPCIYCHIETAGHSAAIWPATEFSVKAVLCGACYTEMTITDYLKSNNQCPICKTSFNPNCSNHYKYYFEIE